MLTLESLIVLSLLLGIDNTLIELLWISGSLRTYDIIFLVLLQLSKDVLEVIFSHLILGLTSTVYSGHGLTASHFLATD